MLNGQEVHRCIQWILNKTSHDPLTPAQGLYLCVVLGFSPAFQGLQPPQSEETKHVFDKLLNCLAECAKYHYFNLSRGFNRPLAQISHVLVMNSSCPGWLTFAAHFYPFFNMDRLLQQHVQMPYTNYETSEYLYMLRLLLPKLEKVSRRNEITLRQFLKTVFRSAPDRNLVFELREDQLMWKFFRDIKDKQKFFTECYLDSLRSSEDNTNIGEILKKILIIPENVRSLTWARLYEYLREFARSHVNPTEEHIAAFMEISLHLPREQMYNILNFLSESTSTHHQDILLRFLSDAKFDSKWKSIKDKVEIGKCWLRTRIQTDKSDGKTVLTAYHVLNDLIACRLVSKYQQLMSDLLEFFHQWLFNNVAHASIIAVLGEINNIDDLPRNVRESFFRLLKDVLRKDLKLINGKEILNQFSNSR